MQVNFNLFQTTYTNKKNNYMTTSINDIGFYGLSKKMKKATYIDGQKDIKQILDNREDKNRIVGQLPKFIIEKIPKENRKEAIIDFYKTFSEITEELRNFDETKVYTLDEITKRRNKSTVEKYSKLLEKYGLVKAWDDVDLEYLGKGGKGAAYKLVGLRDFNNGNEDEFVIKVFHIVEGKDWQQYKSHGCYAEINSAQYWMNNVGSNTNRGKFFWGDMKCGYMINKFIDEDVRLPERTIDPYRYGLKCTDENAAMKHNVCKGYSYDWGGVRVVNRTKNGDKFARAVLAEIKATPENERELRWCQLYNKKTPAKSSQMAGLAMGIKYLDDKKEYIDLCMQYHDPKVNRALSYVLKYLPYRDAIEYFEKLVDTKDVITQIILFNEIPLLAMKHRDGNVKDDLQTKRSEILPHRIKTYYDISEKYALPESIEHLASFVHLLPRDDFRAYYKRLATTENYDLQDRLVYKLSNVDREDKKFVCNLLLENITDERLRAKIISQKEISKIKD
jgi:hypothetical protein